MRWRDMVLPEKQITFRFLPSGALGILTSGAFGTGTEVWTAVGILLVYG